jgi:hypothetical protein
MFILTGLLAECALVFSCYVLLFDGRPSDNPSQFQSAMPETGMLKRHKKIEAVKNRPNR